ncbi:MAG: recombinase family protein [Ruminococcaceae bacterium]|nr:recombinase family protein [Oscillospiraceae bacterium]
MERRIKQVPLQNFQVPKLTRVAAYARVSSDKDAMLHSLSAQVSYYNDLIQKHRGWLFCGVYTDEALTGTKANRENFIRLLGDCRAEKIDMVITKSISRFARNTVTLLEAVRELKDIGVDVYFEEQNIHSLSNDGELMLSILASYAQEESLSASENQKWRVKRNFESGIPWSGTMLGYRYENGKFIIVPNEAEIVKLIYDSYLSGMGVTAIMKMLNKNGYITRFGNTWHNSGVSRILRNYTYTGNLILQKTYRENHLTKQKRQNNGELPQYHITDSHEGIISLEQFNAVQDEIKRRAEKYAAKGSIKKIYPYSGLLVCANCRKHYRRKVTATGAVWICNTYNTLGKGYCSSKQIPEEKLNDVTMKTIGTLDTLHDKITAVRVENNNTLIFVFKNGEETVKRWIDRSRAESWTAEMKENARQKTLERRKEHE